MKYYRGDDGNVYAYEEDGSQDHLIPETYVQINFQLPTPTAADLIADAHSRINTAYEAAVKALTAGYPEDEIASWPKQEDEARAFGTKDTPWINSAAQARGIAPAALASLIIANADALAPLHGALTGKRQLLRDQINALGANPSQAALDAIQW
ncbi:MAG: hypothetical protein J0I90_01040 [Nitrosospira sp.]|nr:hypothetical protein [Nitrosospira sp.]